ncbi:MAG: serine--tRNA ligase [Bacteroidales bacterium]|jgi:seryl-tRNA synthetase|nr:serine--tRNA ligase [Bacteroidales bacterium]MDD2203771.1 serine--tRNA ligase [Bacteroidales bacterium]MDD3151595.1 serine--tRNA ligase [Bacteroidales bacterium]MDD3913290.1 serine--tRNA ligase [Bacteroidales bacterium]MDD4633321.1 serine--tRNA ligase [Bacteroidales bacterium]
MLVLNEILKNKDAVVKALAKKHFKADDIVEKIIELDKDRRETKSRLDEVLAESNKIAKEIGALYKAGKKDEADAMKVKTAQLKETGKELNDKFDLLQEQITKCIVELPNTPCELVPEGKNAEDNLIVHREGDFPQLPANALPHWELAKKYNLIDFELGNKVTGAGFPFYRGYGARLQRALITYFLNSAINRGFIEYQPPLVVNEASGFGTGQLPDKEGQMYHCTVDNFYLIPTAEVPITNIYRDVILKQEDLPIKNVAYSSCFRREAGSYGKDVRGLNRLHEFDKVEIVEISTQEDSYKILDEMVEHVASLVRGLGLPFRIVRLCGGDISFTSALTYDFEVYSAAQEKWLEVSSVSNFESFQANRLKLRYKNSEGKTVLAHTLNGSALALPRIVAAILENYQTEDGIRIPEVLQHFMGCDFISESNKI